MILTDSLTELNQSQLARLSHIDFKLNYLGSIGRTDLTRRFGIKEAAATRDLSEYRRLAAGNLIFDGPSKRYLRAETFKPLFPFSPSQVLTALSHGLGEEFVGHHKPYIHCEIPVQLNTPSLEVLSMLSRAIHQKRVVEIKYRSLTSGTNVREITPFALADNGLRWHVRAFDRRRNRFSDFVMTRISDPVIVQSQVLEHESREYDIQWNRIVELEIIPHPRLKHRETVEFDYGMKDGVLKVNVRAAVAGYVLRRWNVDCSKNHSLDGNEVHLWLRNSAALYGVQNILLAPGYEEP